MFPLTYLLTPDLHNDTIRNICWDPIAKKWKEKYMHEYALKQITALYLASFNSKIQHCTYYENVLQTRYIHYIHFKQICISLVLYFIPFYCLRVWHSLLLLLPYRFVFCFFSNCPYLLKFTLLFALTFDRILRNNASLKKKKKCFYLSCD